MCLCAQVSEHVQVSEISCAQVSVWPSEASLPDRHTLHDIAMSRMSCRRMTAFPYAQRYSTPLATGEGKDIKKIG